MGRKAGKSKPTYVLGLEDSRIVRVNLMSIENDYSTKIEVGQEVYDWLCSHDVKIDKTGRKVFIYNAVSYVDLGLKITE